MQTKTPNVPPRQLNKTIRLQKIIQGIKNGDDYPTIAKTCGCSEKTIDRDMADWRENGGFDKWLLSEFMRLHEQEINKEEGSQAYRTVADLLKKRLKEQQEVTLESGNNFVVRIVDNSKEPEKEADNV